MYDCGFTKGNNWFRYRTGAFIIKDNKILFVKSKIGGYYYMLGGGVHLGETSEKCIEREVFEETGIKAQVERLAVGGDSLKELEVRQTVQIVIQGNSITL